MFLIKFFSYVVIKDNRQECNENMHESQSEEPIWENIWSHVSDEDERSKNEKNRNNKQGNICCRWKQPDLGIGDFKLFHE